MKVPVYHPAITKMATRMGATPRYIANFDSMSAMLRALAGYLRNKDFPGLGITPSAAEPLGLLINRLPVRVREYIYIAGSGSEGIPPERLGQVRAEAVAEWMTRLYPQRTYPAVAVGSASGALVHLCAALGIPWLPQTFLIPVRHTGVNVDEPKQGLDFGMKHADALLEANPDLRLYHMHDANQDRLTLQRVQYFRVKRTRLGEAFERFLKQSLPPGGTIFLTECMRGWPATRVSDRYIFQNGALGGATPEEFHEGSERVEAYLARYDSHTRRWDSPEPTGEFPEAEWGFDRELREDITRFARRHGYRVRRIVFEEPEHLSPFVAALYRWWYRQRRMMANRLLVESFVLHEPYWALHTGAVPFWMKFNMEPSRQFILKYLDEADPYDEIYMMLFSHGVNAVGLPTIEAWRQVLRRARKHGAFVGVEERAFPLDFASMVRYYNDLPRTIPARYPLPGPLALDQLDQFIEGAAGRFPVRWIDHPRDGVYEHPEEAVLSVADGSPRDQRP